MSSSRDVRRLAGLLGTVVLGVLFFFIIMGAFGLRFGTSPLLALLLSVTFVLLGANARALGFAFFGAAILLFALWKLGRWRVRRNNPLSVSA